MKKRTIFSITFLSLVLLLTGACKKEQNTCYWVNSYKLPGSTGAGKMMCLMVQKGETIVDSAWTTFYSPIEGFEYKPGELYRIEVKEEEKKENPLPADVSSKRYTLVKILEQKADPKLRLNDLWVLESIAGEPINLPEGARNPQMEIILSMQSVMGVDGCNNFRGSLKMVGEESLVLGPVASTRKMCIDMTIANAFNKQLGDVRKYEIKDLNLILKDEAGNELLKFKKAD